MFKKLLFAVMMLTLLASVAVVACPPPSINYCPQSVQETVSWSILPWLSLSIENTHTDLGTFACVDTADIPHGNRLFVDGNIAWEVSASVGGTPINGHCPNYWLSVTLDPNSGSAGTVVCHQKATVWIDYHLRNLECLGVGDYLGVVTYTVTAQ